MKFLRALTLFVLLLGFWFALSARLDPLFIAMGVASAAVCAWFGFALYEATVGRPERHPRVHVFWLAIYFGWLVARMVVGAVQVARIVLDIRQPPRPGIIQFRSELRSPAARTMLANSITLVPGTITLEVVNDEFTVHSFTPSSVDDLATARMQNRIAAIFRDDEQQVPELHWEFGGAPPTDTDPESQEFGRTRRARP